jgi:hypothetical protein
MCVFVFALCLHVSEERGEEGKFRKTKEGVGLQKKLRGEVMGCKINGKVKRGGLGKGIIRG